jgi:hypothetical protein
MYRWQWLAEAGRRAYEGLAKSHITQEEATLPIRTPQTNTTNK